MGSANKAVVTIGIVPHIGIISGTNDGVAGEFERVIVMSQLIKAIKKAITEIAEVSGIKSRLIILDPTEPFSQDDIAMQIEGLSGLVLVGGPDVDPAFYGESQHEKTAPASAVRDAADFAYLSYVLKENGFRQKNDLPLIPVLGICRGMQMFAVTWGKLFATAQGGIKLIQHVEGHSYNIERGEFTTEKMEVDPDSAFGQLLGDGPHLVSSAHHQVIDQSRLPAELKIVGWAESDRTPLAMTVAGAEESYWIVQYHAEFSPKHSKSERFSPFNGFASAVLNFFKVGFDNETKI